jgi:hypothetical protein
MRPPFSVGSGEHLMLVGATIVRESAADGRSTGNTVRKRCDAESGWNFIVLYLI